MALTSRIHCTLDREPDSYHDTSSGSVHAVNLGFECESDTPEVDEEAARALYRQFLATVESLVFHVYAQGADGFEPVGIAQARAQAIDGAPGDIHAWLDAQPHGERFWTEPVRDLTADLDTAVDESQVRATHLLRGAQSWSAPVAHRFGLTRMIRVTEDLTIPHIVLPLPADMAPPIVAAEPIGVDDEATPLWRVPLELGDGLGPLQCWTNQLSPDAVAMPAILSPDGYLLPRPGAEATRRVLDWFERSWAGPLAAIPTLMAPASLEGSDPLFDPVWIYAEEHDAKGVLTKQSWTLDATIPAWRLFAGLAATLDPILVALMRPMASGGSTAEGEILAVLISQLLAAFDRQPVPHVPATAADWRALLHRFLRQSPLIQGQAVEGAVIDELLVVLDLDPQAVLTAPQAHLFNILRRSRAGEIVTFGPADITEIAGQLAGTVATGFAADAYQLVTSAAQRLQDEGGCEATIIRLFQSAMRGQGKATTVPDAVHAQICEEAGLPLDDPAMRALLEPLFSAWQGFLNQLDQAFNGLEAVRRSATADFVEALLAEGSDAPKLVTRIQDSAYFSTRLLGPYDAPGCFDTAAASLPKAPIGEPHITALRTWLDREFRDVIAPAATLLDPRSAFAPDLAPHPLPIQVSADFSAQKLDEFAKEFNGIAVALRRRDDPVGDTDPWSHASLAGFRWPGAHEGPPDATGLRQWLPVAQDGRAPMFLDYDGFPFASKAIAKAQATPDNELAPRRLPFFDTDVAAYAGSAFAPVPMLAYGRYFETFSFATTNAGSLPMALQTPDAPWQPRPDFPAPAAQVISTPCQRRTAIGTVSINQDEARPWLGALADVRPLASDYPRLALCAAVHAPGVIHFMRDADGSGMLDFPSPSADGSDASRRFDLSEIEWHGGLANLRIELFRAPVDPMAPSSFVFDFANLDATTFAEAGLSVWLETIYTDPKGPDDPFVQYRLRARVGTGDPLHLHPIAPTDKWWIRLTLTSQGDPVALSFADDGLRPHADRRDAGFMLLRPPAEPSRWLADIPQAGTATIETPRVGYFDFERWHANKDRFAAAFPDNPAEGRALLALLLDAYTERHTDPAIRAVIDRLPDPAVDTLLVELVRTDGLVEHGATSGPVVIGLGSRLRDLAADLARERWGRTTLLKQIEARFTLALQIQSDGTLALTGGQSRISATIPAGTVAEIRVSPIVASDHFVGQNGHPAIFVERMRQLARRQYGTTALAFAPAVLRIEVMHDSLPDTARALALTNTMIACRSAEKLREYALVTAGTAPAGDRNDWRRIGKIDVVTQRWRPTGRPIYSYIKPAQHAAEPVRPRHSVVPFKFESASDARLVDFEREAFFARRDIDAETIAKQLEPLHADAPAAERPLGTELQKFPWHAASATYFRHRFRLHSRYAGALQPAYGSVEAWSGESDSSAAWTRRIAILADGERVTLTRPQLRALMPLTTAPDTASAEAALAPPVIALLQEPPFTEGGLADRIGSEIKLGFGFGFNAGKDAQVGILDSRKEIGPDPRLSYSAMPAGQALAVGLVAEGPIGLTFDDPAVSAPAFANAVVSLSPLCLETGSHVSPPTSLEEHFLGVALRRYLDPDWLTPAGRSPLDATRCLWLDYAPDALADGAALLSYSGPEGPIPLITVATAGGAVTLRMATEEADAGGANAGHAAVAITALPARAAGLSLLHYPVAPGRYSISVFCAIERAIMAGRGNQPLLLASVEWSPAGRTGPGAGAAASDQPLPEMTLLAPLAAKIRATVASASTFQAWTRTNRDFDRVSVGTTRPGAAGLDLMPTRWRSLIARRNATASPKLSFHMPAGDPATPDALQRIRLCPSTWSTPYPLHVHRHLALLGTRYAAGMGRPIEVYAGAAMAASSAAELDGALGAATNLRLVEFETSAAILCSSSSVPATYRSAYFDLPATAGSWSDRIQLHLRFVGSPDYLARFTGLTLALDYWQRDQGRDQTARLELALSPLAGALGAQLVIENGTVSAALLDAGGLRPPSALGALEAPDLAGFLLRITGATGPGEFWTDVSLLHSRIDGHAGASSAAFDFDWLFSPAAPDPALAVRPAALALMTEAQARIISISPAIPIHDTA